jgi:hypothetical protein
LQPENINVILAQKKQQEKGALSQLMLPAIPYGDTQISGLAETAIPTKRGPLVCWVNVPLASCSLWWKI